MVKIVEFVEEGAVFTLTRRTTNVYISRLEQPEVWPVDQKYKNTFKDIGYVLNYMMQGPDVELLFTVGYELKVRYASEHIISAGNIAKLKLGINFTLTNDDWIDITPSEEADRVYEPYGKWLGYYRVIIRGENATNRVGGDPMVAWGP